MSKRPTLYFRNFIFGVEDSLVSTVGLLSGIAIGGVSRETIFLTGAVLILVEAFSMAAGSFLTEASVQEYTPTKKDDQSDLPIRGGAIMFVSYVISGFIPLSAYILVEDKIAALYTSALMSLIALFILGFVGGSLSHRVHLVRRGFRMMLIGGIAIAAGIGAGLVFAV